MNMYYYLPIIFGVVVIVMGICMIAFPKAMTKKELREDPNAVAKTRTSGVVEVVCGIAIIGLGVLRMK